MPETFVNPTYTAQLKASNPSRNTVPNLVDGEVQYAIIPYTLTAGTDEAANDIINLCFLPAGVIPVPQLSKCICQADPGTAFTVDVGTAANDDGWGDGVALTAIGPVEFGLTQSAWGTTPEALAADTTLAAGQPPGTALVFATVKTSTSPTAGVVIDFVLAYKRGK